MVPRYNEEKGQAMLTAVKEWSISLWADRRVKSELKFGDSMMYGLPAEPRSEEIIEEQAC